MIEFVTTYGDEDQNELMHEVNCDTEEVVVDNPRINELYAEVEIYKQAVQDAKDALASAEEELDDLLAFEYEKAKNAQ